MSGKRTNNYSLFSSILSSDAKLLAKRQLSEHSEPENKAGNVLTSDYSEVDKRKSVNEKSFNELIDQVAELDEIYNETRIVTQNFGNNGLVGVSESFDDAKTYSSLQMAFKNPLQIYPMETDKYEDVIFKPPSPIIEVSQTKRDSDLEKLPPLPPKRAKKVTDICDPFIPTGSTQSMHLSGVLPPGLSKRSASFSVASAPVKDLPPIPCSTLPNPKKRGFFSKLFGRKKSDSTLRSDSTLSLKRSSLSSTNSLQLNSAQIAQGGSLSNVSTQPSSTQMAQSGSVSNVSVSSVSPQLPPKKSQTLESLKTDFNTNDDPNGPALDLTEAENYALYMAMAPHATQSEFDELSCYYSPVEGGKILAAKPDMK